MVSAGCRGCTRLNNDGWKVGFTVYYERGLTEKYTPALKSIRRVCKLRYHLSPLTPINKYRQLFFTPGLRRSDRHNCVLLYCVQKPRNGTSIGLHVCTLDSSKRAKMYGILKPVTSGTLVGSCYHIRVRIFRPLTVRSVSAVNATFRDNQKFHIYVME